MDADDEKARQRRHQWKGRFEDARAKDGHEVTQVMMEFRQEILLDWLRDFDQRIASEIRAQHEKTRYLVLLAAGLTAGIIWWLR